MTFKNFSKDDIASIKTAQNEGIAITGSIVSGSYADENIKYYSHGQFQSVYDYPYLSSSANKIFDISVGISPNSDLSSSATVQNSKKINMYNQMAQMLVGFDAVGSIQEFDEDGDLIAGGTKLREVVVVSLARAIVKDEIKKGSFSTSLYVGGSITGALSGSVTISDVGSDTEFRVNSPAGEYGFLTASGNGAGYLPGTLGLVYYQAGVVVLTASVFNVQSAGATYTTQDFGTYVSSSNIDAVLTGSTMDHLGNSFRARVNDISVNNTTIINSRIYNCRAGSREFNYSSNPTYLEDSRMRVKNTSTDEPVSYITTVGLYSADGVLLAVAKLSEPIKKTPATSPNIRVRLDY